MMIAKIRNYINNNKGIKHSFRYRGSRNQIDEFEGVITKVYPAIFIITLKNKQIKTFSYSDLLINSLEIIK